MKLYKLYFSFRCTCKCFIFRCTEVFTIFYFHNYKTILRRFIYTFAHVKRRDTRSHLGPLEHIIVLLPPTDRHLIRLFSHNRQQAYNVADLQDYTESVTVHLLSAIMTSQTLRPSLSEKTVVCRSPQALEDPGGCL